MWLIRIVSSFLINLLRETIWKRGETMSKLIMFICRIFLGVVFLGAGINGYFVIFGKELFISTSPQAMALF